MTVQRAAVLVAVGLFAAGCAPAREIKRPLPAVAAVRSAEFQQTVGSLLGHGFVGGNRIETLENGAEIFPAMLESIRGARTSINFETYIFNDDKVGERFVQALAERARAGVQVSIIFDAIGAGSSRKFHQMLRDAGAEVAMFNPVFILDPRRANHRTHRKLLVVDGKVGFIGGVGISSEWSGDASNAEEWRDVHYKVHGPAVAQLQAAFHENWRQTGGGVLQGSAYFPPLPAVGRAQASVFFSSPRREPDKVELMYHLVIASARKSLLIANAYFIPDDPLVEALVAAAQRGVRVEIIVPGPHIDQAAVRRAARRRYPRLLEGGVHIYEYQPTMLHSKLLIADGLFVSLGSANFDPRSLRINDEANLNVIDREFAQTQAQVFEADRRRSVHVRHTDSDGPRPQDVATLPIEGPLEPQL